jgi:hypothetical protein
MIDLEFAVAGAKPASFSEAPLLGSKLRISNRTPAAAHSVLLS